MCASAATQGSRVPPRSEHRPGQLHVGHAVGLRTVGGQRRPGEVTFDTADEDSEDLRPAASGRPGAETVPTRIRDPISA